MQNHNLTKKYDKKMTKNEFQIIKKIKYLHRIVLLYVFLF